MATLARIVRCTLSTSIVVALSLTGCGGGRASGAGHASPTRRPAPRRFLAAPLRLTYRLLYELPAPVQDPAVAALPDGRFFLLGGLDGAERSTDRVLAGDLRGAQQRGVLPGPQHDAQAASLRGTIYVFGGGDISQYDHILAYDPGSGSVGTGGTLPRPASDVAVTAVGRTAYVVGGFDGTSFLDTIVAFRPGSAPRIVGRLPVGLRYAAAAAVGEEVVIAGGSTPAGASRAVYRFDPSTGGVQQIGRFPRPITHAGAGVLGSVVYVVGGRGESVADRSAAIWSIDPRSGVVREAGQLPRPLSDAAVVELGGGLLVAGGRSAAGTQAEVGVLLPRR